jgi:hypothetical protein
MATELKLFARDDHAVGLRQHGVDRRRTSRRAADRGTRDRRKSERRKARLRSLIFSGYNAGAGVVARYRGIPPFRETRNYVKRVSTLYRAANDD